MTTLFEANVLGTAVSPGRMEAMPELDEMITTRQAWELAHSLGNPVSRSAITQAAKRGSEKGQDTGITGAVKLGEKDSTGGWLLPRKAFLDWLESHRQWNK